MDLSLNEDATLDSKDVIVSDDSIFNSLSSKEPDLLECGQLIIEFLSWRNHCKRIVTIPKTYNITILASISMPSYRGEDRL